LDEAIQIGLAQDVQLQKDLNALRLQERVVQAERGDFLPNLNASVGPSINYGLQFNTTTGQLENQRVEQLNLGVSSGINLFNGFADVASLEQARIESAAAVLTTDRSRQRVVSTVIAQFLELLLAREQIEIQEENLEAQNRLLERIEEFANVGTRPVSDLFQQQAAVAQAELQLLNAEQAFELRASDLIQTLQLDPTQVYEFVAPQTDDVALVPTTYDYPTLIREAFERRPDLLAQRQRVSAGDAGIRVARSQLLPSLDFTASTGTGYTSSDPLDRALFTQFEDNRSSAFRFSLSIPIFNRYQTRLGVERAQIQLQNAELDLLGLEQQVAAQVRQQVINYQNDVKRLDVTEKQLRAAEQSLEAEQERYNVGASTLVELSQARASFVQASRDRSTAVYQFLLRGRLVELAVGTLSVE
ncbi:MAG: TolC family protein, partial [Bacteroidota bacterium]